MWLQRRFHRPEDGDVHRPDHGPAAGSILVPWIGILAFALCYGSWTSAQHVAGVGQQQQTLTLEKEARGQVDAVFSEYDRSDSPGCALGVYRDGAIAYERGYGRANLEYDIPISPDTVFRIGSTSKQFAAFAVLLLEADGELSTTDPVRKWIPELQPHEPPMTVEHLVHHTSGMRDYLTLMSLRGERDLDFYTDAEVLDILARQRELNFVPGTEFLYSNSGYFLLSVLVQRVSGKDLGQFAQERIFGPLGMHQTHFHNDSTRVVRRRASGYEPADGGNGFRISQTTLPMIGDGGVFTTVRDLLLWDQSFSSNELLDAVTREKQLTPASLTSGASTRYAYGLFVDTYRGLPTVSHGGAFVGYRAELLRFPDQRLSISVLCNLSTTRPSQLARQVADVLLKDELEPRQEPARPPVQLPAIDELETARLGDLAPLDRWLGAWSRDDQLWFVRRQGKRAEADDPEGVETDTPYRLVLDTGFFGALDLEPVQLPRASSKDRGPGEAEPTHFALRSPAPVSALVELSQSGEDADHDGESAQPAQLRFRSATFGIDFHFERRTVAKLSQEALQAAAGRYYSPELDVHYRLDYVGDALDGPLLWAHLDDPHRDLIDAPLHFTEERDRLSTGRLEFRLEREESGAVTGFRLGAGRVQNLHFSRIPEPARDE